MPTFSSPPRLCPAGPAAHYKGSGREKIDGAGDFRQAAAIQKVHWRSILLQYVSMNIDSLPLTAFALEASGAAALAVGSVHTLTLGADTTPLPMGASWIGGQVWVGAGLARADGGRTAAPAEMPIGLTLTF